jgi:NAD(P)-dependent dehydrogenase (short-subunit alcohol dehydrogenase family)
MLVALAGRDVSTLEATAAAIADGTARAIAIPTNVADPEEVDRLVRVVGDAFGPVDLLVNNAGITENGPIWESDPDVWWRVVEVNLRGAFLCSRAVLPEMVERGRGRIVNVSSGVGNRASADQSAYAVSKAALTRLTDSLDAQVDEHGVSVFALSPGLLRTDMGIALEERRGAFQSSDWTPPARSAALLVRIARGDFDELSGRLLQARDDIDELMSRAGEIRERDLYQLRLGELA